MADLSGARIVGKPFAVWSGTMQAMPGGAIDAGFGRFFIGVQLANTGAAAWPITHARLSCARGSASAPRTSSTRSRWHSHEQSDAIDCGEVVGAGLLGEPAPRARSEHRRRRLRREAALRPAHRDAVPPVLRRAQAPARGRGGDLAHSAELDGVPQTSSRSGPSPARCRSCRCRPVRAVRASASRSSAAWRSPGLGDPAGPARAPAGRAVTASVAWGYQRLATIAELMPIITSHSAAETLPVRSALNEGTRIRRLEMWIGAIRLVVRTKDTRKRRDR